MTTKDVIVHWRMRARETMRVACMAHEVGSNADALFHCHLAIERALKAAIMERTGQPHPRVHDLLSLAKMLSESWDDEEIELFDELSDFAVAARYDDPDWATRFANSDSTAAWIERTERLLSKLLP